MSEHSSFSKITYADILQALQNMPPERLADTATVYIPESDEFKPIGSLRLSSAENDVLDEGHPYFETNDNASAKLSKTLSGFYFSKSMVTDYALSNTGLNSCWNYRKDRCSYSLIGFANGKAQFERGDGLVISLSLEEADRFMSPT